MNKHTAIITGATGFVGYHLTKRLVENEWNVNIVIRPGSRIDHIKGFKKKVNIHEHDGSTGGLITILQKTRPDIVFHLASLFLSEHKPEDIEQLIKSNVLFSTQLLEAMTMSNVYNLVNTGTSWQHYNKDEYNPVNLYAATKQAFIDILAFYIDSTPLKAITLKLFDTYGPEDTRKKLFFLLRKAANEQIKLAMSPGDQLIDLVYINDVIDAFVLAAKRLLDSEVDEYEEYMVSSQNLIKLKDLVSIYSTVTGRPVNVEWGGRPYRSREVMVPWNNGKLLPGWNARVKLDEGISIMEESFIR